MRLRTQFVIFMFLFGIILVAMAVSAIITNQRMEKASGQERIAADIAQGANELSYLGNDYLIYRESQQLRRWQSRFASFSSQVASLHASRFDQQALVANIRANQKRLKEVFDSVVFALGNPSTNQRAALNPAFLQVSWSRMAVQSQGLVSDASRLSQLLHQERDQLTEARTMLIYGMVGLFGVLLLASYMLTYRRILKSLATLQAGTAVIGSGNLDFRIREKKNDEIGDLSHAFNRMTTNLKAVTASKADLEKEVTQRKQAEEGLRRQREWLRITLSSIGDAVIASDTQGRLTFLNPIAASLTGWQTEEAMGQPIQGVFRIINEKTRAPVEDLVARVLNEKCVVGLANDTALVTKDGREVPIEDSAAPIQDAAGNVTGVVLVFHDVTEKRRAQEALLKAHERAVWLARFPDQNPNPVIRASANGTVLYCNPASENLPGWACEVGQLVQAELAPLFSQAIEEGKELQQDLEIEKRIYSIWITPFPEERYSNLYGRDITERKRAEEELRQRTSELQQLTESLEQRVQERTQELAVTNEALTNQIEECQRVASDLRKTQNNLRQLSMALLNAQERERKLIAQEIHDSMGASLAATKFKVEAALKDMGDDIPQASAALESIIPIIQETIEEARRIQMSLRPSILDDIGILATINWFCRQYESTYSNIRIRKEIEIEEHEVPDSLKIVIYRVLQEALNNIAKHSKSPTVLLVLRKSGRALELVIRDSGQGLDLSEVRSRVGTGRGLGLDSMRERTELSGGSFSIESDKGKGTVIRALWPI
jgi:PAS domain S-box-containing protein